MFKIPQENLNKNFAEKYTEHAKSMNAMLGEASRLISQVRKMQKENDPPWKGAEQRLIKQAEKYLKLVEKEMKDFSY